MASLGAVRMPFPMRSTTRAAKTMGHGRRLTSESPAGHPRADILVRDDLQAALKRDPLEDLMDIHFLDIQRIDRRFNDRGGNRLNGLRRFRLTSSRNTIGNRVENLRPRDRRPRRGQYAHYGHR